MDISKVREVHLGGMVMDDSSPSSDDIYEAPFVIMRDSSREYVSPETAKEVKRLLALRPDSDDSFGTPGG